MLQMFADEMEREGHKGWQVKLSGRMYRSTKPGREVMTATMDGQATDPAGRVGVVECKLKIFGASEWERHGIPDYVVAQGQHQADVVDGPFTLVLALLGGYRLRWRVLERDDELLGDVIVPAELDFWERYQAGEAFPIDEGAPDANADLLRRLYPEDDGTTVTLLGQEWVDAARQWRLHATAEGAHKKQAKVLKSKLQGAMGNASFAKLDGGATLSNLTVRKGEQHHKATTYRVLREVAPKKTGRRR
jgi:predicted phage-related endonuclease